MSLRHAWRWGALLALAACAACAAPPAGGTDTPAPPPAPATAATQRPTTATLGTDAPPRVSTAPPGTDAMHRVSTPTPTPTIPVDTVVERGALPPGFSLTVYADVFGPTSLAFGPDGRLYVASTNQVVYALADTDGDHRADERQVFAGEVSIPLGLLWVDQTLYISYNGHVQAVRDDDGDGRRDFQAVLLDDLPAAGRHQNDGLALGPDGYLYLGMGSSCDVCREPDPRSAAILRFRPDGSDLSVVARGLRNPYDLAFNPAGDLFATDNGRDDLGRAGPPEELNHIVAGGDYGWPACDGGSPAAACANAIGPIAEFAPRSSANGLAFYTGDSFPPAYHGDLFVAVLGSYVYTDLTRGVQRVRLTPAGDTYTAEAEWFLRFETEGRPLDVTIGPEGGLYVADYELGLIYRIVYGAP